MIEYGHKLFTQDVERLWNNIKSQPHIERHSYIVPVMRGGCIVASELSRLSGLPVETCVLEWGNPLIVDDLIDSGSTREKYKDYDFACLHIKHGSLNKLLKGPLFNRTFFVQEIPNEWIHYWWEPEDTSKDIKDHVIRMIEYIGEDPTRKGLIETPDRIIRSWSELYKGYTQKEEDVYKVFEDEPYDQMVLMKDIEMYSMCEHHMLPFFGRAHVAYIPDGNRVIGASKLARLVDVFARRMQIQERICEQVTDSIMKYLKPKGAACVIEAAHMCMRMRGVGKQGSEMVTSSLKGVFLNDPATRMEFMMRIGK